MNLLENFISLPPRLRLLLIDTPLRLLLLSSVAEDSAPCLCSLCIEVDTCLSPSLLASLGFLSITTFGFSAGDRLSSLPDA